jgi:hypothetical protein
MDHEQIDRLDLIDQYLMGKLPAEVSSGFEEHFADCPQCIARLQTTKSFLRDLRLVAAEQAAQIEPYPLRRSFRHIMQSLLPKPLAWAVVCLLIAAAAGMVYVIDYTRRLQDEVAQAKSLSEQWQRRYEDERQSAMAADRSRQEAEAQRAEQLRGLEAKLNEAEAQRAKTTAGPGPLLPAEGNLAIFILTSVRSSELSPAQSVNRIPLPRSATVFAFSIPLEGETRYEAYHIRIHDDRHRLIRRSGNLTPGRPDALSIWLKSSLFQPGFYTLIVEGDNKDGGRDVIGNYPFLIVKSR